MGGSWVLHEMLYYPIMYRNNRCEQFPKVVTFQKFPWMIPSNLCYVPHSVERFQNRNHDTSSNETRSHDTPSFQARTHDTPSFTTRAQDTPNFQTRTDDAQF